MLWNAFLLAIREIRKNVMRSVLTILGIVIGVASVIAMVILGDGTTSKVTSRISKLGSNMLTLSPGQERHRRGGKPLDFFDVSDSEAVKREISGIKAVAPTSSKTMTVIYGNNNHSTSILGSNNDYFIVKDWELKSGREFSINELKSGKAVCIIGDTTKNELFADQSPIGENIRVGTFSCQIIGMLKSKGSSAFGSDQDDTIIVPIKMLHRKILGNQNVSSIRISVKDDISMDTVNNSLRLLFRERRKIDGDKKENFHIRDMKDIISAASATSKTLTMLLGAVAAISLIVGGIGIMNIMLVSVTERTKEIGIRLAIGALEKEVLLQFLVEAVVLSALGGIIGIILGLLIALGVTQAIHIPFVLNTSIVITAFVFSTFIGIVFGYFPAKKAASLNPIDALRHE